MSYVSVDWTHCEALAQRAAGGDTGARRELIEVLWPVWLRLARGNDAVQALGTSEDDDHEVAVKVVAKVCGADGHELGLFPPWRERNPGKTFQDWMCIVVANVARDHVRERLAHARAPASPDDPTVGRVLNEFVRSPLLDEQGVRPAMTVNQTARQLIEFARERLPPAQLGALTLWIDGATFAEIAAQVGVGGEDAARKLVHSGVAVLRRHFAGG